MRILHLVYKALSNVVGVQPRGLVTTDSSFLEKLPDISHFRGFYLKQIALIVLGRLTGEIVKPAGVFIDPDCTSGYEELTLCKISLPVPFAVEEARICLTKDGNRFLIIREIRRAGHRYFSQEDLWNIHPQNKLDLILPHEMENDFNPYWLPENRCEILHCLEKYRSMQEVTLYVAHSEEALDSLLLARGISGKEGDYERGIALGIPESAVSWFVKKTSIERNNDANGFLLGGNVLPASLKDKDSCWWEPSYPLSQEEIKLADRASEILGELRRILPKSVLDRFEC